MSHLVISDPSWLGCSPCHAPLVMLGSFLAAWLYAPPPSLGTGFMRLSGGRRKEVRDSYSMLLWSEAIAMSNQIHGCHASTAWFDHVQSICHHQFIGTRNQHRTDHPKLFSRALGGCVVAYALDRLCREGDCVDEIPWCSPNEILLLPGLGHDSAWP